MSAPFKLEPASSEFRSMWYSNSFYFDSSISILQSLLQYESINQMEDDFDKDNALLEDDSWAREYALIENVLWAKGTSTEEEVIHVNMSSTQYPWVTSLVKALLQGKRGSGSPY